MITLRSVTKRFGDITAVDGIDLFIPEGQLTILLGPSGCGKTTTLRAINRLTEIDEGEILLQDKPINDAPAHELRRHMGYAIQSVGLFPNMSVTRNIGTVPRLLGWDKGRIAEVCRNQLELVGLDPDEYGDKLPHELSGGEAQRVGVARALAADPPVLLMDEPFGALDPISRERLQREFADLHRRLGKTVVFVTHDIEEAVLLGDRIVLMRDGSIVQEGSPEDLWRSPATEFVKDFFGDEFGLRILSRHRASDLPLGSPPAQDAPRVSTNTNLRDVLAIMVTESSEDVAVERDGEIVGGLSFCAVVKGVREST